jgi:hypothetical protein
MVLKDASAFNIQFVGSSPILIDSLSFERWVEGTPWVAYRQFCQHFLGPLALMSATDVRLGTLSRLFIDGPPLDLVSTLLPVTSKFHPSLLVHLHLHSRAQAKHGGAAIAGRTPTSFTRHAMLGLVDHLESAIERLAYKAAGTTWADYYANTNYTDAAMAGKHRLVAGMLDAARPSTTWDLGANTGAFSRLAADVGAYTIAIDGDPAAVERAVLAGQARNERRILPLVMDLANPTGAMGWAHEERSSLAGAARRTCPCARAHSSPDALQSRPLRHDCRLPGADRAHADRRVCSADRLAGGGDALADAKGGGRIFSRPVRTGLSRTLPDTGIGVDSWH